MKTHKNCYIIFVLIALLILGLYIMVAKSDVTIVILDQNI